MQCAYVHIQCAPNYKIQTIITLTLLNSKKLFKNLNGLTLNEILESNQVFYYTCCNTSKRIKFAGPTAASSHPSNIAALKEMSQRYKVAGNAVFDLTRLI